MAIDTPIDLDKVTQNLNNDNSEKDGKPSTIIGAISQIQQYSVFEKDQQKDINSNFFTLGDVIHFFKIGLGSGFLEGLLFITLIPFLQTIYPSFKYHFLGETLTKDEQYFFLFISYAPIIIITLWLSSLVRFYHGSVTKKATVSLLTGRTAAFFVKGVIIYIGFGYLYTFLAHHQDGVYGFLKGTKIIFDLFLPTNYTYSSYDLLVYFYMYVHPAIKVTGENTLMTMVLFGLFPFITITIRAFYMAFKKIKGEKEYEEY